MKNCLCLVVLGWFEFFLIVSCQAANAVMTSPVTQCWECSNYVNGAYNAQCPMNDEVDVSRAYRGPCQGKCFTRTDTTDPALVFRGCTATQWGLPSPSPDGCYRWGQRSQLWCLCADDGCNSAKLGQAGNVTFEQYVQSLQSGGGQSGGGHDGQGGHTDSGHGAHRNDTVLPPSFVTGNRTGWPLQCWQCLSYFNGHHYPQCPLHGAVNALTAYIGNCTGRCFLHNTTERTGREVPSGVCLTPSPDGCYPWYSEVWCVCSTDGCNGVALGTPGNMEFDFQPGKDSNRAHLHEFSPFLLSLLLLGTSCVSLLTD